MKKFVIFYLLCLTLMGCGKDRTLHFYSVDRSQCITVINKDTLRYVIDGKHSKVPESNYIVLSTEKIPPLGDGFHVCWKNEAYDWQVIIHKAVIIEDRLDSSKFNFNVSLPEDERGIPTEKKFRQTGCAVFDFYSMKLTPEQGAIVEID